jgi:hypothetical protein
VAAAEADAVRIRQDADDYCDRRLAMLEDVLEQAGAQVRAGRERLVERAMERSAERAD